MSIPQFRKPNRLPESAYKGLHSYLVTICTSERRPLFTTATIVQPLICSLSEQMRKHSFDVHAYCFMPDHCHFLLDGLNWSVLLSPAVRSFKGHSTVVLRNLGLHHVWQKGFHDHVIRNAEDHADATAYILENPAKSGLVKNAQDWPFSGSLTFQWRSTVTL